MTTNWRAVVRWTLALLPLAVLIVAATAIMPSFYRMKYEVAVQVPENKKLIEQQRSTIRALEEQVAQLQAVIFSIRATGMARTRATVSPADAWVLNRLNAHEQRLIELERWRWAQIRTP